MNIILLIAFSLNLNTFASSPMAFELFERQYKEALMPTSESLQEGELWHCSSGLYAARNHFRYVQYWEPSFIFQPSPSNNVIKNIGPHELLELETNQGDLSGLVKCPICSDDKKVTLRMTTRGDLILAYQKLMIKRSRSTSRLRRNTYKKWTPVSFSICENPGRHNDSEWDSNHRYWDDF